ncbi:hypothetical protein LWI29_007376 [Acer saccharum]|uniref:Uncharacterized protein n=1 Tax=Acer saccharum TaxID=4024 RepID=A0AA39VCX0_ACESA|nr:hypothetical protein LWI29_007376 [Acer saccharum]
MASSVHSISDTGTPSATIERAAIPARVPLSLITNISSQPQNIQLIVPTTHSMITRSKTGSIRPRVYSALCKSPCQLLIPEPTNVKNPEMANESPPGSPDRQGSQLTMGEYAFPTIGNQQSSILLDAASR